MGPGDTGGAARVHGVEQIRSVTQPEGDGEHHRRWQVSDDPERHACDLGQHRRSGAGRRSGRDPDPGCWTAYPAAEGSAFTTLCGDGTIAKYSWSEDGSFGEPAKSEKIFDAENDPLFGDAMRIDGNLAYVSFGGSLYLIDDSGEAPTLSAKVDFAEDGWAPSGYNLMGYNEPTRTLFVLMHSNPGDGTHKYPAEEIWANDMESQTVVGRSEAHGESSIAVSNGETPELIAIDHLGGVHRYEASMGDSVSLTEKVAA